MEKKLVNISEFELEKNLEILKALIRKSNRCRKNIKKCLFGEIWKA